MKRIKNLFARFKRRNYALFFDKDFYLERNYDVRESGHDPLNHYLRFGWREGRDPSPSFSTKKYLEKFPELVDRNIDPITHFIENGRKSGTISDGNQENTSEINNDTVKYYYPYFDEEFYLENYKDIANSNLNPFYHYMNYGWREHRNPSSQFNTEHYIKTYDDVAQGDINPLEHFINYGKSEGRSPLPFSQRIQRKALSLKVTAIVPNFNHAPFLEERLNSILNQTYQELEIIILDDCSTDDSRTVIEEFRASAPDKISTVFNEHNSGSIFAQWRRGIEAASGDLIWICESDDFCEPTFLEEVIQGFADDSVLMSFGRIQFSDRSGALLDGLDGYREQSMPGIWDAPFSIPAAALFRTAFGTTNIIPNVGGCVFRRQDIASNEWREAMSYRILGDWYLYLILARGGKIHYSPKAISYFRQHGGNTSVKSFISKDYYTEHAKIAATIREYWGGDDANTLRLYQRCEAQYDRFRDVIDDFSLPDTFNLSEIISVKRKKIHILMGVLGFDLGGGELFPVYLANELVKRGYLVSFLALRVDHTDSKVRQELDGRVSVYDINDALENGVDTFLDSLGVDLIHSHFIGVEYNLLLRSTRPRPYIITLHGSYDTALISDGDLLKMIRGVDRWVYLTSKNLNHLDGIPLAHNVLRHIPNGVPEVATGNLSREELDIPDAALVFAVASRAIAEKGWRETIAGLEIAQQSASVPLYLILCGTGPLHDDLLQEGVPSWVRLLGYRNDVREIYGISDVVVLATRFMGESFPLTLIQAMQAGKPIISTAIGEIETMISDSNETAGILLPNLHDDSKFIAQVSKAATSMLDDELREQYALISQRIGTKYGIKQVATDYENLFSEMLAPNSIPRTEAFVGKPT